MTLPPAESYPPPPPISPDESLTSPLNQAFNISDQSQEDPPPSSGTDSGPGILIRLRRRMNRAAKYPSPFKRCFEHLEFWKLCAMFWAIFGSVTTLVNLKLISKEYMRTLLYLLTVATFSFTAAHTLQDMIPEVAVAAMLTGIGLMIALFHTVVFKLLQLSERAFRLTASVSVVAYTFLLGVTLYKLFQEDVREQEDTYENPPGIDAV